MNYMIKNERLLLLIARFADNLAEQERILRQVTAVLQDTPEEPEDDMYQPEFPGFDALVKGITISVDDVPPAKFQIKTEEEAAKYGHPIGSTLLSMNGDTEIWTVPCSSTTLHVYPNEAILKINKDLAKKKPV